MTAYLHRPGLYGARHAAARGLRRTLVDGTAHLPRHRPYIPRHRATASPWRRTLTTLRLLALATAAVAAGIAAGLQLSDEEPADLATAAGSEAASAPTPGTVPGGSPFVEHPARAVGPSATVALGPSSPTAVEIPSIGVRSELSLLGLDESGAIEAPRDFDVAGWFLFGPQPGQPGPAVIAGHVDSRDGPAVFHRLHELAAGDEVIVHRADGTAIRFTVKGAQSYPKNAFPTASVYGPVPGPELRLITCGGEFDRSRRQYRENVVVYAVAAPPRAI
ncbi:MAG: class F sortase [Acidimicrobiales bacterium]